MKKLIVFFLLFAAFFGLYCQDETDVSPLYQDETSIVFPDEGSPGATSTGAQGLITGWDIVRMILIFLTVLLVIYFIFRLLKRAGSPNFQSTELIKLHGSLALGTNRSAHLVEVGQEMFLIGSGESSVNLISKIEDKESLDELRFLISSRQNTAATTGFQDLLGRLFNREKKEANLSDSLEKSKDFLKGQRDRLKKM